MTNYWVLVAPKSHVLQSIAGGFAQAAQGKSHPLRRMSRGDGVIYYSPKLESGTTTPYQRFTGIGCVMGEEVYQLSSEGKDAGHRRTVKYLTSRDAAIAPLIQRLKFIKDKERWGHIFRFAILHIPVEDFKLIASVMNVNINY